MKRVLFPGSFDPLTNGHVDIIERASNMFDEVVVVIMENSAKKTMFTMEERLQLCKESCKEYTNVVVEKGKGLSVEFAKERGACAILRGVRSVHDFEYEKDIASINHHLNPQIETILLYANETYAYVSSTIVKEMVKYGQSLTSFVPEPVRIALQKKNEM